MFLTESTVSMNRKKHETHQIFYDEATRALADAGFVPLENPGNPRPDWYEYWPIRKYLRENPLDPGTYYGFFSPKFEYKTNLSSAQVDAFIQSCDNDTDVIFFSPAFDHCAFFLNVFEQVGNAHQNSRSIVLDAFRLLDPNFDAANVVMTSQNTIFCNYFVARPRFWQVWLSHCERIFALCEADDTPLAKALNATTNHGVDGAVAPLKIFVIERIASFILLTSDEFKARGHNPSTLAVTDWRVGKYQNDLMILDALKMQHVRSRSSGYLQVFFELRDELYRKANQS